MGRSACLFLFWVLAIGGCGPLDQESSDDGEEGDTYVPFNPEGKADTTVVVDGKSVHLGGPISFAAACDPGDRYVIAAVGDVLLHGGLQTQATQSAARFRSLFSDVDDLIAAADLTYANLEGPTARGVVASGAATTDPGLVFDGRVYTSYPQFNYHPSLIEDLIAVGVDVVSTANNHALDRRALGADRTVEALAEANLPWTGTRARSSASGNWHTATEAGGLRIAWLACTYGTNGIPDTQGQVLGCFDDTAQIEAAVRELAASPEIDAVIVTPHWGTEYVATPGATQIRLAHRLLEAGALAVLGSHPHVLEPWEKYKTSDGRETFVIYSLGNFVSGQQGMARRTSMILYLGLTRSSEGTITIHGVRHVPLYMHGRETGVWSVKAIDRSGGAAAARALVTAMFGSANLQDPDTPLSLASSCP